MSFTPPPPAPERLQQAADLFADGASQREVQRTTGLAREILRRHFPAKGWTYKEGGDFRALTSAAEKQISRISA